MLVASSTFILIVLGTLSKIIHTQQFSNISVKNIHANELRTFNLMQILTLHAISSATVVFDDLSVDASEQFLHSIVTSCGRQFRWNIVWLTNNRDEPLPERSIMATPMSGSQTVWYFVFVGRLVFGRELCDLLQQSRVREAHHLSLVLVLGDAQEPNSSRLTEFLRYVWKHSEPMNLIALLCPGTECIAYRFYPDEGLTRSTTLTGNANIYRPSSYPAARRFDPPPNSSADELLVKFETNFLFAYDVVDMARDHRGRLVGFFVWTAGLLAELLGKRLHVITVKRNRQVGRQLFSTSLLDWMDRMDMRVTLAESWDQWTK